MMSTPEMPRFPKNPNRKGFLVCGSFAEAYRATLPSEPYYMALVSCAEMAVVKAILNELSAEASHLLIDRRFMHDTPLAEVSDHKRVQELAKLWLSLGALHPDNEGRSLLTHTIPSGVRSAKRWHVDDIELVALIAAFDTTEFAIDPVSDLPFVAQGGWDVHSGYKTMSVPRDCAMVIAKKNGWGPVHRTPLAATGQRLVLSKI